MKHSLIALCALLLAGSPQIASAEDDLDAFFSEAGVWPDQIDDIHGIAFHDEHYFIGNGYQLQILKRVEDSGELAVIGSLDFERPEEQLSPDDGLREVVVIRKRAYIKEQRGYGIGVWHAVDISDLTSPELKVQPEFASHRTIVSNGRVAVSSTLRESKLFEVDESGDLVLKYFFDSSPIWGYPHFLGDYLIMQLEGSMLTGVDVSDLENPIVMERVDVPDMGDLTSWKNYVFNRRSAELEVYDFTVPTEPRKTTSLVRTTELGFAMTVVDYPYLYIAGQGAPNPSGDRGLIEAYNIADPINPRLIGQKVTPGSIGNIALAHSQLVVAARHRDSAGIDQIGQLHFFDLPDDRILDSDRDGVPDVTEFAVGEGEGTQGIILIIGGTPTFQYGKSATAIPNFDYMVEVTDLQGFPWEPALTDNPISSTSGNEVRSVPLDAAKPYARLRVTVKE